MSERTEDLLQKILEDGGWLKSDTPLSDFLSGFDYEFVAYQIAVQKWTSSRDLLIAVRVTPSGSGRNNRREVKDYFVDVNVAARQDWVKTDGSVLMAHEMRDLIEDVLTTNHSGTRWRAKGVAGGGTAWDFTDAEHRYQFVTRLNFRRDDVHVAAES